ncbi:uncharacterized protein LOC128718611 [Anopheles marshallii]|uniref:uncharacterized protein LOC128718611 n=1 Tax=Anopheles marshallii TaxID=1521116 RepID=UPI00237AD9B3|nr:uncharacterized protein LOC128718611 [Anopheles marshallii]
MHTGQSATGCSNNMATRTNQVKNTTSTGVVSSSSVSCVTEIFPNEPNHLMPATMIMLRAYQLYRDADLDDFTITINDSEDGKFDDVVVWHKPMKSLSPDALFIEAKDWYIPANEPEQGKERIITKEALMSYSNAHSIAKYFITFLNIRKPLERRLKNDKYVVCTNARLDHAAVNCFSELVPENNDILSFTSALSSTCYRFNPYKLNDYDLKLREACLEALAELMASHIVHRKVISHENPLFTAFADFIKERVVPAKDNPDTCYQFSSYYKKNQLHSFLQLKFHGFLQLAYQKLNGKCDSYLNEEFMINQDLLHLPFDRHYRDSLITTRLADFYKMFILVCCPHGEKSLHNKTLWEIKHLSKTSSKTDQETILNVLQDKLMDALQNKLPIDPKCVGNALNITMHAGNILRTVTCKYLQSLKEQCSTFIIYRDRLKMTGLYTNLLSSYSRDILHYRGCGDVVLKMWTIAQTLALVPSCEGVFIDSIKPEITQHLDQLLAQPTDVFQASLIVIALAETLDYATLQRLERRIATYGATWKHRTNVKIIVLQQSTIDHSDEILVSNLTSNCRQELYERYATLHLFGTRTSLGAMVLPTDSLAHLKYVLDTSNDTQGKENVNIHQQRYDKIHSWYIYRDIDPTRYGYDCYDISTEYMRETYYQLDSFPFHQLRDLHYRDSYFSRPKEHHFELRKTAEKIINLDDVSGAGKTAYFTWLARDIQAHDPLLYVLHINAAEHSSSFDWLAFNDLPSTIDTEVIRTLFRLYRLARTDRHVDVRLTLENIQEDRRQTDRLAKLFTFADGLVLLDEGKANEFALPSNQLIELRLFREKVNRTQVVFMLDGVDEVEPTFRAPMLRFVEVLSQFDGVYKIFLSTIQSRGNRCTRFPKAITYGLKPLFCEANLLLHNLLLQHLNGYRYYVQKEAENLLLPFLNSVVINSLRYYQNIPLLLYMAYSLYLPAIKRCVSFKNRRVHGSIRTHLRNIDTFQVLKRFVDGQLGVSRKSLLPPGATTKKLDVLNTPKRQLALLAVHTMLDKQYTDRFLTQDERTEALKLTSDCNVGKLKVEFLTTNHDGTARFTNRLFAEYFATCWLFENRTRLGSKRHVMLAYKMLASGSHIPLRCMFNRIAIEGCTGTYAHSLLCRFTTNSDYLFFHYVSEQRLDPVPGKDATGRTILHWLSSASSYLFYNVLDIIPAEQIDAKDELFHWSALDYAFVSKQWSVMGDLIQIGAKVNIDVWLDQLRSYDLAELFDRITMLEHRLIAHCGLCLSRDIIINDSVLARHVLSAVSSGIVQHLLYEKNVDIRRPLAELSRLTVLEYCAKQNLFGLLEHFISFANSSNQLLGDVGSRLFELSVERKAYNVAIYLMDQCDFHSNLITKFDFDEFDFDIFKFCENECIYSYNASDFLSFAMELKNVKLFRLFFNKLCEQYQYACINDENIVEESFSATNNTCTNLREIPDEVHCYFVRTIEFILKESLYRTNFHTISYIVQKIKLSISNQLLRSIIEKLPIQTGYVRPVTSSSLFNYLLDRTYDLYGRNDDGQTLLHTVGANGCAVMMHCLIDRGFDPLHTCAKLKQNVFHYIASSVEDRCAVEIYHQLLAYHKIDQLNVPNIEGYNVCDIAIMKRKYRLARVLIHAKANGCCTQIRVSVVLDSFKQLLEDTQKNNILNILNFLTFSYENTYADWKDAYAIIHHRMPVV